VTAPGGVRRRTGDGPRAVAYDSRMARSRPSPPSSSHDRGRRASTIRLRLTAWYATVFLITGAGLLTIGYLLVRSNLSSHHSLRAELSRLGITPVRGEFGFAPDSQTGKLIHTVQQQILGGALHRLLLEYVVALVVMTAVSAMAGWLLAGRALAPLRRITATARRVSSENLGERIALTGPADELKELADTFDRMLGRLDGAFASQRHFVANASHELRTPLAIMRTEVDVALGDPDATGDDLRAMGEAVRDMVDRSERLIASLLLLARSEATTGHEEPVDLAALVGDCITDLQVGAHGASVSLVDDLEPAWVRGDPSLLDRLVANLLDNGIHHNERGGRLAVSTRVADGRAVLVVANGGEVIDPARVQELAEPFRRLDRSRPGFGLGLSIVRSVAEAHGGHVELSAPTEGGLEVRVELPALDRDRTPGYAMGPRPGPARAMTAPS
jgi:signal transduction histidine kinase